MTQRPSSQQCQQGSRLLGPRELRRVHRHDGEDSVLLQNLGCAGLGSGGGAGWEGSALMLLVLLLPLLGLTRCVGVKQRLHVHLRLVRGSGGEEGGEIGVPWKQLLALVLALALALILDLILDLDLALPLALDLVVVAHTSSSPIALRSKGPGSRDQLNGVAGRGLGQVLRPCCLSALERRRAHAVTCRANATRHNGAAATAAERADWGSASSGAVLRRRRRLSQKQGHTGSRGRRGRVFVFGRFGKVQTHAAPALAPSYSLSLALSLCIKAERGRHSQQTAPRMDVFTRGPLPPSPVLDGHAALELGLH